MISFSATVAPIFKSKCTNNCHGNQYNTTAGAYTRLTAAANQTNQPCQNVKRITVGNGAGSLVVQKMLGTQPCGTRMPHVGTAACSGNTCVPAADTAKVSQWIDQGALNN